jgi:hypothetical protein
MVYCSQEGVSNGYKYITIVGRVPGCQPGTLSQCCVLCGDSMLAASPDTLTIGN